MPGLIETHGHLIVLGHGDLRHAGSRGSTRHGGDTMLTKVMEIAAKQLLMAGVTTAVDLGAPLAPSLSIRDRINKGEIVGTRMLVSGPWITRGVGGAMQEGFGGVNVTRPAEAAAADRGAGAAGVDVIKAHSGLTRDDYKAIVDAAHKNRIRVHAHVYAETDVRNALETGVDVLPARRLGRHRAAVQPGADHRHRQRRASGRGHRRASRVGVSRHGRVSRAAAGSAS